MRRAGVFDDARLYHSVAAGSLARLRLRWRAYFRSLDSGSRCAFHHSAHSRARPLRDFARGDFFATAAELAGAKTPASDLQSISFVPALLGKPQKEHEYLYWEFHERGSKQAVRFGRWKAIRAPMHTGALRL